MSIRQARKTPGVYVTELDAFPPSVVGIQTAVPAFIGYTQTATLSGKPIPNKPIRIGSLADYEQIFGGAPDPTFDPMFPVFSGGVLKRFRDPFDFKVWAGGGSEKKSARLPPTSPPVLPLVISSLGISPNWPNDAILIAGSPQGLFWDPLALEHSSGAAVIDSNR